MSLIKKITRRLRQTYLPTDQDRAVRRWWKDGGDEVFRFDYPLDRDSLVIDCGGYRGQWASDLFARFCCNIVIFEPVDAFARIIKNRFEKNDKIEVFQYGLGAQSRSEMLNLSNDGSSIFGASVSREEIRIVDVKEWFANADMAGRRIHLMKINIEGGEFELLERLIELELIENIENIQVQFHDLFDDAALRMERIQQQLERTHHLTFQYRFVWENWEKNRPPEHQIP